MLQKIKIGYFEHWFQPLYKFVDFLRNEGLQIEKVDYTQKNYLEKYDLVIIEQNGFNDFIENDEPYIQQWVKNGGIMMIMHQDYQRWAPYFLPKELGHTNLIHRYIQTINGFQCAADPSFTEDDTPYMTYLMPWVEKPGKKLFSVPEKIAPDEMLNWDIEVNTFGIIRFLENQPPSERVRTAALSCFLANPNWEILGSFMDCGVKDGALILRAKYGKGMYFLNQILFPEVLTEDAERCLNFWKKYVKNLVAYFERFKNGETEEVLEEKTNLPIKRNYKMSSHMHSLDWYGADSQPGTINAIMRYMNFDICSIAVKDNAPFDGVLDVEKYSDDKVLMLNGQEYHPFNWNDKYAARAHNVYHTLAIGIDPDAYTNEFTCSLFSDEEAYSAVEKAIDHIHSNGGAACATHPYKPQWIEHNYDAVDYEPSVPLGGTDVERFWMDGGKIAIMSSVDLYGPRRILDNPATNFIYLRGEIPCRESVVKAIKRGNTIAAVGFDEADIYIGDYLPGDEISIDEAQKNILSISAKVMRGNIRKVRVYSGAEIIYEIKDGATQKLDIEVPLKDYKLDKFIRVEIEGQNEHWISLSTPFYLKA